MGKQFKYLTATLAGIAALLCASLASAADPAPMPAATPAATTPAPAAASPKPAGPPALIPSSLIAKLPFVTAPQLSPDGKQIAAYITSGARVKLGVFDLASGEAKVIDPGEKLDFNWFRWAGNDRVLLSVGSTIQWEGDDAWQTRLIVFDVTDRKQRFIGGKTEGVTGDDVLWIDTEGKTILLAFQTTVYDYPSVSLIDLSNNRAKQVVGARTGVWNWYADNKGVVRAAFEFGDSSWKMIYRASASEKFHTVVKAGNDEGEAGFSGFRIYDGSDEGYRLMRNEATGRDALYRFNFATRKRGDLVFEASGVDVDLFYTEEGTAALLGARFIDDRPRAHWIDPTMAELQVLIDKAVNAALGDRTATIVDWSRDRSRMLIDLGGSNDPGRYFVFDTSDGIMKLFAQTNEKLKAAQLTPTRYTRYKTRDGLEIPAYLTLPPGRPAKNLPLVILPHGGPYDVRDEGTYDAEVQFLANRGYVVLQPEYRGSGGYGKDFYEKGEGQWGRAMQDDLDDGMDWLAKQGTIDPKRVCLVGSSYGGYAAMWGAVRNPERYRCAASFAGVSDLKRQLKYQIEFKISKRYRKDWRKTVQGDEKFDLTTVSPLFAIDKLKVPLLLVHGDEDQRVPYKQSKLYADALERAGKPYEFITLKGEGHGFSSDANRQLWLDKLDTFLTKHNPAS